MQAASDRAPDTPGPLYLSPHVRACSVDKQVLLLDLRRNRYLGVGGHQASALSAVVGWPAPAQDSASACDAATTARLAAPLLEMGLLTHAAPRSEPAVRIEPARRSLDLHAALAGTRVGLSDALRFVRSTAAAACWLRTRSLHATVQALAARRSHRIRATERAAPQRLLATMAQYETLRPLVFTTRDKCLFDSLALVHFLAHNGILARWVIGVKTHPFRAHAWVQLDDLVLNDLHEHIARYRPILVV